MQLYRNILNGKFGIFPFFYFFPICKRSSSIFNDDQSVSLRFVTLGKKERFQTPIQLSVLTEICW